ncbi:MAG TPA: class I SAM-dependent methyltransferase [Acidimicrobiia bacterium]|nr:class I SAM-dependent methyltransferase [Acidimicrobiia bacterium]
MGSWEGYDAATYGDQVADVYDRMYGPDDEAVACLADLAGTGPVLELGIGTGRLALPLADRGLEVHGIDSSQAMVDQLRAKPGGDDISVTIGDFADVDVDGSFPLVFIAFNTFFALIDVETQQRCFENVAAHLTAGGRFVVGVFVPDTSRWERDQHLEVQAVKVDGARLSASRHDPQNQRVDALIMWVSNDGVRTWPARLRYSYPRELDEMAAAAGLALEHRWSGWGREPFADDSTYHVSVYVRE